MFPHLVLHLFPHLFLHLVPHLVPHLVLHLFPHLVLHLFPHLFLHLVPHLVPHPLLPHGILTKPVQSEGLGFQLGHFDGLLEVGLFQAKLQHRKHALIVELKALRLPERHLLEHHLFRHEQLRPFHGFPVSPSTSAHSQRVGIHSIVITRIEAHARDVLVPLLLPVDLQQRRRLVERRVVVVLAVHCQLRSMAFLHRATPSHHTFQRPRHAVRMQRHPQTEVRCAGRFVVQFDGDHRGFARELQELERENRGDHFGAVEGAQRESVFGQSAFGEAMTQHFLATKIENEPSLHDKLHFQRHIGLTV